MFLRNSYNTNWQRGVETIAPFLLETEISSAMMFTLLQGNEGEGMETIKSFLYGARPSGGENQSTAREAELEDSTQREFSRFGTSRGRSYNEGGVDAGAE